MPMPTIEIKVSNVPNKNMRIQQVLHKSAPTMRLTKKEEKVEIIVSRDFIKAMTGGLAQIMVSCR